MNLIPRLFAQLSVVILICYVKYGLTTEKHGSGGIVIMNNGRHRHRHNDLVLIGGQKGCGPTLIKSGGHRHRHNDMIIVGGCEKKKKVVVEKKVEYVPYPVKEYVPVMVKKEEPKMHMPMMHMPMDEHGMGMASMHVETKVLAVPYPLQANKDQAETTGQSRVFRKVRKFLKTE